MILLLPDTVVDLVEQVFVVLGLGEELCERIVSIAEDPRGEV